MKRPSRLTVALMLSCVLVLPSLEAQEIERALYSAPFGLTENESVRVLIAPMPLRVQGPTSICNAEVTLEYLDANDLTVLSQIGPVPIAIGTSFQSDFTPDVGPAPQRQEVVIKATLERTAVQSFEEGALSAVCPLRGSVELLDVATGKGLATFLESTIDLPLLSWNGFNELGTLGR